MTRAVSFGPDELLSTLRGLPAAQRYWVAYSGGLDSSVLLHALMRRRDALGGELRAIHVNHHIQPRSDDWQAHCQAVCAKLNIPLECRDIVVAPRKGESLEAVAREQRYAVYRRLLRAGDLLLLAHHQDDQLETFLLQALRGAGLRGLASMPAIAACGAGRLARLLLAFPRTELLKWARAEKLNWIDDPSNADTRFDRNYLRQRVLPLIHERWPAAAETVARSARHCAEALDLLAALAEEDLARCADPDRRTLNASGLHQLGEARAKNLLRHWLETLALPLPPAHKLAQVFSDLLPAAEDRNPCVRWQGAELRRFHGRLYALPPLPTAPVADFWLRPGEERSLGSGLGRLRLVPTRGEGVRAANCPIKGFKVSFRVGGEQCRPAGRPHHRPLKKWLQEAGIVPWMRDRLPLIYAGETLAAVAGLFVCQEFAAADESALRVEWRDAPLLH